MGVAKGHLFAVYNETLHDFSILVLHGEQEGGN